MNKIANLFKSAKSKVLALLSVGFLGASNAIAAGITFQKDTGFGGEFDLTYFYSAIGIVVTAIAIVAAISVGIRQFRKI